MKFTFSSCCNYCKRMRKTFFNELTLKYPDFNTVGEHNKISFLFNNIDPFICKKVGHFCFRGFHRYVTV